MPGTDRYATTAVRSKPSDGGVTSRSSRTVTRTTSLCTDTAVRTSKAPPSFTKLGMLLVLFALVALLVVAVDGVGGVQ
ncbi:hypothetical protein SAMN04487948_105392 [Halogranum amylolyticum]|uniref:Uncharacterized protein n=1 Tax=Halogranum amylolyticum TaxID=660520 RepID=A0A1H8SZ86_9EURY|nr:hypothetical protein [Halogranum amylolyticum]SEO83533.1 hypothetical protein SAMN04487948_105392 [Halogranum amylolyticum]